MTQIKFKASIHRMIVDKEGEGRLTLIIPSSDLPSLIQCVTGLECLLNVTVEPEIEPL